MLWQPALPTTYTSLTGEQLAQAIADRRRRLGERLVILGHHYQRDDVLQHADLTGDSLKLSRLAASIAQEKPVEHVIFCGVHFMAESADMLTPEHVKVILPDLSAGCSMADMADYEQTVEAWQKIREAVALEGGVLTGDNGTHNGAETTTRVIPITYVNSSAAIKAFVGAHEGACCTSTNAARVFEWAMAGGVRPRGDHERIKILFLPDQHLGRNTAAAYGIDVARRTCLYDPRLTEQGEPFGGTTSQQIADCDVILWAGHCSVHKLFRPEHCDQIREANQQLKPGQQPIKIVVHPECAKEVVDKADASGSTEMIIRTIEQAQPGECFAVGTEHNLVNRLATTHAERGVEVRILSDCQCMCTTMYRIDQPHLLWALDGLCGLGPASDHDTASYPADTKTQARNVISVHPEIREPALQALDRMLSLAPTAAAS